MFALGNYALIRLSNMFLIAWRSVDGFLAAYPPGVWL